MKLFKKTYWLIYPILFTVLFLLIKNFEIINNTGLQILVSTPITYVLSPKAKIVQKQHGEEEQIKWLFFKKVINHKI
ncbi:MULTISPECIES: hypothetical protein [unclassified Polaribacter]|uniref:hypothetical protein n=1 Tax=unclassified Polaribacter TaxID=196858 RepID=UPI0011BDB534|nr:MULTISPECIES: hypothetical protein [unclassified Polaribacter]TXD51846.1 hypothetical protein ES043_10165 [Polaribacter sp. IC063]TXD59395.1 hypothetical protein ES044_10230 [Polaribacter sp. IC066]